MSDSGRLVVIGCERSAGAARDRLTTVGQALPRNVEWVDVPCGSQIDELHILRALESGADSVLVLACYDDACRSLDGSRWAAKRVDAVRQMLTEMGIPEDRVRFEHMAPNMAADLLALVESQSRAECARADEDQDES